MLASLYILVPKLQLGYAVLEALLRRPDAALVRRSTEQALGREAELPESAFPSWSLGTRSNEIKC